MWINYFLLVITIVCATANNILLRKYKDREDICNVYVFNACVTLVWLVILLILGKGMHSPSLYTMLFAIAYGLILVFFLLFKTLALENGPVSITSLITSSSLIIPSLSGAVIWKESISGSQVVGLVALLIAIYFVANPKYNSRIDGKYVIYAIAAFFFAGASGFAMKIYTKTGKTEELNDMMVMASLVAFVTFGVIYFVERTLKKEKGNIFLLVKSNQPMVSRSLKYILLCGITSCVYQRLNLFLSGELPSIIFFPIFNGALIVLSCVAGVVFFKEKLTKKQIAAILVGGISIMLMGEVICF